MVAHIILHWIVRSIVIKAEQRINASSQVCDESYDAMKLQPELARNGKQAPVKIREKIMLSTKEEKGENTYKPVQRKAKISFFSKDSQSQRRAENKTRRYTAWGWCFICPK